MTSFAGARTGLALALAGLTGLTGCSKPPDQPLDTGAAENQTEPAPTPPAGNRSAPDNQTIASRRADPVVPAPRAPEESPDTSRPSPPRTLPSEPAPAPEPASPRSDSAPTPADPAPAVVPEPESQGPAPRTVGESGALGERDPPDADAVETARAVPAGTTIRATLQDSISSRKQSAGDVVAARIRRSIKDRSGRVVVPAGSRVELSIAEIEPAKAASPEDARLVLKADSILINGRPHQVRADVQAVPYKLQGRGITGKEAGKVGIGAAAGAVLGRVLSGETEGAVVGGAVGAAGGAAVAARRARRDVVVKPGTQLVMVLKEPLVLPE
jgi:hypothetical protein